MSKIEQDRQKAIYDALEILELPHFVTFKEIKTKYRELSKKYHPDIYKGDDKMSGINWAYEILKEYIENFRYTFDEEEIQKQYPESFHTDRFRF